MAESGNGRKTRGAAAATGYYDTPYFYDSPEPAQPERPSWLVPLLVAANVAVFLSAMYVNDCPAHSGTSCVGRRFLRRFSFQPLSQNPLLGPSSNTLQKLGALEWEKVVHQHQGWRLISCICLHAGVVHLLTDMISLIFIGIRLEQQFGFARVGIIYLLSGFGGSVLSSLFIKTSISVGASGSLFGLLGAMLAELITNWTIYSNKAAALSTLLVIILVNLVFGILPYVNNFAHIGGFLTGFLLGFILLIRPQFGWIEDSDLTLDSRVKSNPKYKDYQYVLWLLSLAFLVAGSVVGLSFLFMGKNAKGHCHWCRYLSCLPTSKWSCEN